jgi:5-methylthioadenosine/S-adenosylhomocysteine deaminase
VSLLVAADWVLPVASPPLRDGAVLVRDGAIAAVGPRDALQAAAPDAAVEAFPDAALVPGFVNAHTHLEYGAFGGFGDGRSFAAWLAGFVGGQAALDREAIEASAALGALECLRSGVTTVADCSHAGAAVGAARSAGLRAIVHLETFGAGDPAPGVARLERALAAAEEEAGGLVELGVSPHAPYTVGPELYRAVHALAAARDLPLATHLAESAAEIAALRDGSGELAEALDRRGIPHPVLGEHPVARLHRDGVLDANTTAVHCVQVGDAEIAALAASGAAVVHCPRSNAMLGCGAAPVGALRAAGVRVGLGSDSPASALDFDHFAELRAAVATARTRERRADALSAAEALELATLGSARALGIDDRVGSLAPGLRADLAVVSLADTALADGGDPAAAVVYGGSPERVLVTIVDGDVRYRKDRDGSRLHAAIARAASARATMFEKAVTR